MYIQPRRVFLVTGRNAEEPVESNMYCMFTSSCRIDQYSAVGYGIMRWGLDSESSLDGVALVFNPTYIVHSRTSGSVMVHVQPPMSGGRA